MALIKKLMTPIGVEADYWRITRIDVDKIAFSCYIEIRLYYTKHADQSIDSKVEMITEKEKFVEFFSSIALKESFTDIYNAAYEFVKRYDPFFADAETDEEDYEIGLIIPTGPTGEISPTGDTLEPEQPTGSTGEENTPIEATGEISPTGDESI